MLVLTSPEFGQVEVDDSCVYEFPIGLPGFEDRRRFALFTPKALAPIQVLLSTDEPPLRFYVLDTIRVHPLYNLQLSQPQRELLGLGAEQQPSHCLLLLTWLEEQSPTVNLLAPVVLHESEGRGLQAIQFDSGYPSCHPLSDPPEALC